MTFKCASLGCNNPTCTENVDYCMIHYPALLRAKKLDVGRADSTILKNSEKYPAYFKPTKGITEVDVYAVHKLFEINDPSGAIQHASKKLLLSGVRTGGKSMKDDIREARDTLNRWLELIEIE